MDILHKKVVCIVGLGLIGTGIARLLKKQGMDIIGVETDYKNRLFLQKSGLLTKFIDINEVTVEADIIILCSPINHIINCLPKILDLCTKQVIIDIGSVKKKIADTVNDHPNRKCYISMHPLWGSEKSGPENSMDFVNFPLMKRKMVICDHNLTDRKIMFDVITFLRQMGIAKIHFMSSIDHDLRIGFVSHLPRVLSFVLKGTLYKTFSNHKMIEEYSTAGYLDFNRLSLSSDEIWYPIIMHNERLIEIIDGYINELSLLRDGILLKDEMRIREVIKN